MKPVDRNLHKIKPFYKIRNLYWKQRKVVLTFQSSMDYI